MEDKTIKKEEQISETKDISKVSEEELNPSPKKKKAKYKTGHLRDMINYSDRF